MPEMHEVFTYSVIPATTRQVFTLFERFSTRLTYNTICKFLLPDRSWEYTAKLLPNRWSLPERNWERIPVASNDDALAHLQHPSGIFMTLSSVQIEMIHTSIITDYRERYGLESCTSLCPYSSSLSVGPMDIINYDHPPNVSLVDRSQVALVLSFAGWPHNMDYWRATVTESPAIARLRQEFKAIFGEARLFVECHT